MTFELILAALLAAPVHYTDRDESGETREARLRTIASAIHGASRDPEMQAALITEAVHESGLAAYVTEGRCEDGPRGARCDTGQARGPWQVWQWCAAHDMAGEAKCAARMLAFGRRRCHDWSHAFGSYATGGRCLAMPGREATMGAILRRYGR